MSRNAVQGYEALGGQKFWPNQLGYGGGSINRWADINGSLGEDYWERFNYFLGLYPDTDTIWLNLCTSASQDNPDDAPDVIEEIERLIPAVTVYVSGQPDYSGGHVCSLAGASGPSNMAARAATLVADGLALAGPSMGPLSEAQTSDGCHANEAGKAILGGQLLDFFG